LSMWCKIANVGVVVPIELWSILL